MSAHSTYHLSSGQDISLFWSDEGLGTCSSHNISEIHIGGPTIQQFDKQVYLLKIKKWNNYRGSKIPNSPNKTMYAKQEMMYTLDDMPTDFIVPWTLKYFTQVTLRSWLVQHWHACRVLHPWLWGGVPRRYSPPHLHPTCATSLLRQLSPPQHLCHSSF